MGPCNIQQIIEFQDLKDETHFLPPPQKNCEGNF